MKSKAIKAGKSVVAETPDDMGRMLGLTPGDIALMKYKAELSRLAVKSIRAGEISDVFAVFGPVFHNFIVFGFQQRRFFAHAATISGTEGNFVGYIRALTIQLHFPGIERSGEHGSFTVEDNVARRSINGIGLGGHESRFVFRVKLPDVQGAVGCFSGPREVKKMLPIWQKTGPEVSRFLLIESGNGSEYSPLVGDTEYSFVGSK
jgi:hypothetical protein